MRRFPHLLHRGHTGEKVEFWRLFIYRLDGTYWQFDLSINRWEGSQRLWGEPPQAAALGEP